MPPARRQVRHTDLVDSGEIRILDFDSRNDLLGLQLEPFQVIEGELDLEELAASLDGAASDDIGAVRELDDGVLVLSRRVTATGVVAIPLQRSFRPWCCAVRTR